MISLGARGEEEGGHISIYHIYTYIHVEDGGISDEGQRWRGKLARDFVVEGRGREKAVEKGWVVRDAREMSERESEQLTIYIYIYRYTSREIRIYILHKCVRASI